ncbi:unnamed protein product, partial [Ostreobium quekettii]
MICEGSRFDDLMGRALDTSDELLFKVLRNCCQHDNSAIKKRFEPHMDQLVDLLKAPDVVAELFVEVLGCLANLNIPEFDFHSLASRHGLLEFLSGYLEAGAVDDDILLEVVMFLAVLCNEQTAPMIVE